MGIDEKTFVREVVRVHLHESAPGRLPDLEADFDPLFAAAQERERALQESGRSHGQGLPFDASFGAGLFVGTILWVALRMVREALAADGPRDLETRLKHAERQLCDETGRLEMVVEIRQIVLGLAERMDRFERGGSSLKPQAQGIAALSPSDTSILRLLVRREGPKKLIFEVQSDWLGLHNKDLGSLPLEGDAKAQAQEELGRRVDDLSDLALAGERGQASAQLQLADMAVALFRKLPRDVRHLLWSQAGKIETLEILSDEPYIPWELMKLQDDEGNEGLFLCEAFRVTRWLRDFQQTVSTLPLRSIALVLTTDSSLPSSQAEKEALIALAGAERLTEIEPSLLRVKQALSNGNHDGWHFTGHGSARAQDPNRTAIHLQGSDFLTPENLVTAKANLSRLRPLVFLNGCDTGRGGFSLTGLGGWAQQSLEAGAGAFLGTLWPVRDRKARAFASAFYRVFLGGAPIAEAVRQARLHVREQFPGDPAWLAYTVYAFPGAVCSGALQVTVSKISKPSLLKLAELERRPESSSPEQLLRAEYEVAEGCASGEETFEVLPLAARLRPQANAPPPQQIPRGYRFLGRLEGSAGVHFFRERDGHVAIAPTSENSQAGPRLIDKYAITNRQFCRLLNDLMQQDLAHVELISGRTSRSCIDSRGRPLVFDSWDRWQRGRERHPAPQPAAPWGMTFRGDSWEPLAGSDLLPATLMTWWGARLYGLWVHGEPLCGEDEEAPFLPDLSQWQAAAIWDPWAGCSRRFPWGNEWRREWVNYAGYWAGEEVLEIDLNAGRDGFRSDVLPLPVASLDEGRSALGCVQMIGNVWEWCANSAPSSGTVRLVVGGACNSPREHCDARSSRTWRRGEASAFLGFRCCFPNET